MATRKKANGSGRKNHKLSRRALITGIGAGLTLTSVGKRSGLALPAPTPTPDWQLGMDQGSFKLLKFHDEFRSISIEKDNNKWRIVIYPKSGTPVEIKKKPDFITVDLKMNTLKMTCGPKP